MKIASIFPVCVVDAKNIFSSYYHMITGLTRISPLMFRARSGVRVRELSTIVVGGRTPSGHKHHRRPEFMMTCSCGIGSSPADHDRLHHHPPVSRFPLIEEVHDSVAVGAISVSAAIVAALVPSVATPLVAGVFVLVGIPSVVRLLSHSLTWSKFLDVHALMTLSAIAALLIGQGPEGAFLLSLFQFAHAIQHRMVARAKKDVHRLADVVPDSVQQIVRDPDGKDVVKTVDSMEVPVGSIILVRPNSVVPIDGKIIKARLSDSTRPAVYVQLAHLTGEPVAVEKFIDDFVPAGAVNSSNFPIEIQTTQLATSSTLQRIVALAETASRSRPRIGSWISEVAPKYSSAVLAGTACIGLCGPIFFKWTVSASLYKALSFLVAASPCALLVASPVAQAAAVSACSKRGIVLSGGAHALERFSSADSIALDKTGTITEGRLDVVETSGAKKDLCLLLGGILGKHGSTHPISQAIGRSVSTEHDSAWRLDPMSVEEIPGERVSGTVRNLETGTQWTVSISKAEESSTTAAIITIRSSGEEFACTVSLQDKVRLGVAESIAKSPLPIYMLTGDNEKAALQVASLVGIPWDRVHAHLSPEGKAQFVTSRSIVMVGDGINDAPALASAKSGGIAIFSSNLVGSSAIAMGDAVVIANNSGSNVVESALFLVSKSKQTESVIKSNIGLAIAGMLGTAAAVMVGNIPLWLAVVVHEGSTVLVVLNSLRNL